MPSLSIHLFHILAIVNSAAVNIGVHVSFSHVLISSGYMPRSGLAGSYDGPSSQGYGFSSSHVWM